MGFPNTKGSEQFAILASTGLLNAATGQTAWIPVGNFHRMLALVETGANAVGPLNAQLMQAQDATGTGAKPMLGVNGAPKALTPIANAASIQALIDAAIEELDTNNGYGFVQLQIAIAGASLISGLLLGINARFEPANLLNAATVAQITG